MRVNQNLKPERARFLDNCAQIIEICDIILPGTRMFDGFPCHDEAQKRQPPFPQAGEMFVYLLQRKWTPDKRDLAVVIKAGVKQFHTGRKGDFARSAHIYAAQNDRAVLLVNETRITDFNHTLSF